jgi:hypothetical protein
MCYCCTPSKKAREPNDAEPFKARMYATVSIRILDYVGTENCNSSGKWAFVYLVRLDSLLFFFCGFGIWDRGTPAIASVRGRLHACFLQFSLHIHKLSRCIYSPYQLFQIFIHLFIAREGTPTCMPLLLQNCTKKNENKNTKS